MSVAQHQGEADAPEYKAQRHAGDQDMVKGYPGDHPALVTQGDERIVHERVLYNVDRHVRILHGVV